MKKISGYIYKRNGVFYIAYPDSSKQSGLKRESTTSSSKRNAKRLLDERLSVAKNNAHGWADTNAFYTHHFMGFLKLYRIGSETYKTYRGILKLFVVFLKDKYPMLQYLHQFNAKVFADYRIWLKETRHKDWTVKNHLKVLKTVFNKAKEWELIQKVSRIDSAISIEDAKPIVTLRKEEECQRFFEVCKKIKPDYYPHYFISARTGLRYGEMVSLLWDDVDLEKGFIRITRHRGFNPKGRSKRTGLPKERLIPLTKDAVEVLKSILRHAKHKNVFLKNDKPISRSDKSFRRWLIKIAKKAGVDGMTRMHELRHTTGHQLGDQGIDIYIIKTILGHSDIRTTERYVGVPAKGMQDAIKKLEGFGDI